MEYIFAAIFIVIIIIWFIKKIEEDEYYYKVERPKELGEAGENYIEKLIKTSKVENYIINDLIIRDKTGKTSQIDHIVINQNGIFVIETKNYTGRIYGNDSQQNWTQVLSYGKKKYQFYNPIKQNATHIYKLKEITKTKLPIKSIVVFVQGNIEYIESENVYTPEQMLDQISQKQQQELSINQIEEIYNQLNNLKVKNTITTEDHVENINQTMKETNEGICPRCGGKLKERKGQYGVFYGCSNYPKCKFTKK